MTRRYLARLFRPRAGRTSDISEYGWAVIEHWRRWKVERDVS